MPLLADQPAVNWATPEWSQSERGREPVDNWADMAWNRLTEAANRAVSFAVLNIFEDVGCDNRYVTGRMRYLD